MTYAYPDDRNDDDAWHDRLRPKQPADGEIKSVLVDRLRRNPHTKNDRIRVDVERNVVILTGEVSSPLAERAAGEDAWNTAGVADVSNQLTVARQATA